MIARGIYGNPWLFNDEVERPIVAQIFGADPASFYETARLCVDLGFDGIDINTGCPDRNVNKQGAGAALINNPTLMAEIVRETKRGAGDLPVTVKTRIGYETNIVEEWVNHLLDMEPVVITIHARTRNQMSKVPADWRTIAAAAEIARDRGSETLIVIKSTAEGRAIAAETGCDGVMIARGIYGNPWLFNDEVERDELPWQERLKVMLEHTRLFNETYSDIKHFAIMKKHYKAYVSGFGEAKGLRVQLMETRSAAEVEEIVERFLEEHG
jgi:tRNA-dihydrouridine synthase